MVGVGPNTLGLRELPGHSEKRTALNNASRELLLYCASVPATLAILWVAAGLHGKDWSIPFCGILMGDTLFHTVLVKSLVQNGWYLFNPYLGAPTGSALYDFNYAPTLHLALIKLLSPFSSNACTLINLYFVLTFPLSTVTALLAFRSFRIARWPALAMAILFSFLPFHFLRGETHLPYASYYMVPLGCMVALWLWNPIWTRSRYIAAIIICAAVSFDLPYWPMFTAFLIIVAAISSSSMYRSLMPLKIGIVLVAVILASSVLNLSPNLAYRVKHGPNDKALMRFPQEAEIYGLKIVQMLLPEPGHRLVVFEKLRGRYDQSAPLVNENSTAALGLVASLGFCFLLLLCLVDIDVSSWPILIWLSRLNLACVLLGTIGGFGSFIAFTISDKVRGYNRISVVIGFLALCGIGMIVTELCRCTARWARCLLCVGLVALGSWDQIPPACLGPWNTYSMNQARMSNDGNFIRQIEKRVPEGAMIFELPYQSYPEGGPINRMMDYEPLSPYLYSVHLRWSAGAIKGRAADAWQRQIALSPAGQLIETLKLNEFRGIYIDRDGYTDNAKVLESQLASLLGERPIVSGDGRLSFFELPR